MKTISIINYVVLILPIILGLAGITSEACYVYALLFTVIASAVQVILAMFMLFKYPGKLLYIYSFTAFLFLLLLMILGIEQFYLFLIPPILALFLTYIIFTERRKEKALQNL
jgi:hypothetical protein